MHNLLELLFRQKDRLIIWKVLWITAQTTLTSSNGLVWQKTNCQVVEWHGLKVRLSQANSMVIAYCTADTNWKAYWEMAGRKCSNFHMMEIWGPLIWTCLHSLLHAFKTFSVVHMCFADIHMFKYSCVIFLRELELLPQLIDDIIDVREIKMKILIFNHPIHQVTSGYVHR